MTSASAHHTSLPALSGRMSIMVASLVTTGLGGWISLHLVQGQASTAVTIALLSLFTLLLFWIALSFWTSLAGFASLATRRSGSGLSPSDLQQPLRSHTAILIPVYNEDPNPVFANLAAMYEDLARSPQGRHFDFFVLSDTTEPRIWIAEEAAWYMVRRLLKGGGQIHYRKRLSNSGRKAGNIADFCRRWGRNYDYMVVLDADSLMSASTLLQMVRRMDANPRAGLMQVPPVLINRHSLFARIQQFSSALATPILAHGLAFFSRSEGNFWGHNAIIRVRAFTESCGLPELSGRKPFGGTVLSHDFVEAALLRRAGWQVWLLPDLDGSYEEPPPSIMDHALRDRRWCQGNLQHLKVLPAQGLHWVSRLHLLQGIFSYLASPLWLAFLVLGIGTALQGSDQLPSGSAVPVLGVGPGELMTLLLAIILTMLFAPRLLGLAWALRTPVSAQAYGGRTSALLSLGLEMLFSALLAPIMMILHSRFVLEVLLGRDSGWKPQQRSESQPLPLAQALKACRLQVFCGMISAVALLALPLQVAYWFSPILAGLLLAPLLVWLTSHPVAGRVSRHLGLFLCPTEIQPEEVILRTRELATHPLVSPPESALRALSQDQKLCFLHKAVLAATVQEQPDSTVLNRALRRYSAGEQLEQEEENALLSSPDALQKIAAPLGELMDSAPNQTAQAA
ncbi:MAG: glucans biosynthesis glucosyltransferase MdoH [Pseudomonadota bacterium]